MQKEHTPPDVEMQTIGWGRKFLPLTVIARQERRVVASAQGGVEVWQGKRGSSWDQTGANNIDCRTPSD